jgi:Family of unknown function (DUF6191)
VGLLWAMSLPGLVCLLVLLVALERFGLWAGRRSWLPWRRRADRLELSAAGLDEFAASFHPSKRVELSQRNTELMLRDDAEGRAPLQLRIDLDAGTAFLPPRKPRAPA